MQYNNTSQHTIKSSYKFRTSKDAVRIQGQGLTKINKSVAKRKGAHGDLI